MDKFALDKIRKSGVRRGATRRGYLTPRAILTMVMRAA
jgi:hypothetical protein